MPPKSRKTARKAAKRPPAKPAATGKPTPSDHAAVDAWIAHVIPERRGMIKRIDRILRDEIPDVVRTTKYRKPSDPLGTPFYGRPGHGWIAMVHSLKNEIRVTFFAGAKLDPPPPIPANAGTRRVDITSHAGLDEAQLRDWARQASQIQGWARV